MALAAQQVRAARTRTRSAQRRVLDGRLLPPPLPGWSGWSDTHLLYFTCAPPRCHRAASPGRAFNTPGLFCSTIHFQACRVVSAPRISWNSLGEESVAIALFCLRLYLDVHFVYCFFGFDFLDGDRHLPRYLLGIRCGYRLACNTTPVHATPESHAQAA